MSRLHPEPQTQKPYKARKTQEAKTGTTYSPTECRTTPITNQGPVIFQGANKHRISVKLDLLCAQCLMMHFTFTFSNNTG